MQSLTLPGITLDIFLSFTEYTSRVVIKDRKGLTAVKTMAMPQKKLLILFQLLVLSVIYYVLGLLILSSAQLNRLETVQKKDMQTSLGCTHNTSSETMGHILCPPSIEAQESPG